LEGSDPGAPDASDAATAKSAAATTPRTKVTTNYLYLAEKLGVEVHELHEVYDLVPLKEGGFEVHVRHPGWAQRAAHLHHHTYTAEQVIVAAHAYGSSKLLHHMRHKGRLTGLSNQLGQRARTNSEQLPVITRPYGEWKRDPEKIHIMPGSVAITSGVWQDAVTSIEPVYYGRKRLTTTTQQKKVIWSRAARDLLFETVVSKFGPHLTWKSYQPRQGARR
jgi:choline dehydrogenase-like flavoprotein